MKLSPGFHMHNVDKILVRDKKVHHSVSPGGSGLAGHKIGICEEGTDNLLVSKHKMICREVL